METKIAGSFRNYENVSNRYMARRQLQGNIGWFLIWGLGIATVITGNFTGWNIGLAVGGFGGLAFANFIIAIMYLFLMFCLVELSAMFPHSGGCYSFTRNALGPFWGYLCGIALAIDYIFIAGSVVVFMSNYLHSFIPTVPVYLWWLVIYTIFVAVNLLRVEVTLSVALVLSSIAIVVLVVFYFAMLTSGVFSWERLTNIPLMPGQSNTWFPKGWWGIFAAMPYAIWFYITLEQLPQVAEETDNVPKNMPTGALSATLIIIVLSLLTLVLNSGVGGGAEAISKALVPIQDGLAAYFGEGATSTYVTTFALLCGVAAGLLGPIFGYGRIIFSLSRAGYIPRWISIVNDDRAPARSVIVGSFVGLVAALFIQGFGGAPDVIMLYVGAFGALFAYILVALAYIVLKINRPDLPRPYKSPIGNLGAVVGGFFAIVAFVCCAFIPDFLPGLIIAVALMVCAICYYWFVSKDRLVAQAPEELAALANAKRGR